MFSVAVCSVIKVTSTSTQTTSCKLFASSSKAVPLPSLWTATRSSSPPRARRIARSSCSSTRGPSRDAGSCKSLKPQRLHPPSCRSMFLPEVRECISDKFLKGSFLAPLPNSFADGVLVPQAALETHDVCFRHRLRRRGRGVCAQGRAPCRQ